MPAVKNAEAKAVNIPAINIQYITLKVVGDTPLIVHRWTEKAKKQIRDKKLKKATKAHETLDAQREYFDSLYWLEDEPDDTETESLKQAIDSEKARFAVKSVAFNSAAVDAGFRAGVTKNTVTMKGAFHIIGDLVEIHGVPEMREDPVRVNNGGTDLRYRGEFKDWSADIEIRYNAGVLSVEQIANLFNLGGFACGIGEWRPEKGGSNGMFHIELGGALV